jgi:hypothetical protein
MTNDNDRPIDDRLAAGDRFSIRELVHAYFDAADRQDGFAAAAMFVPDGVLAICPNSGLESPDVETKFISVLSPTGIETMIGSQLGSAMFGVHVLASHVIESSTEGVNGRVRTVAHRITRRDTAIFKRTLYLHYDDTYARLDSQWRFARRDLYVDFTEDVEIASRT